MFCKEPLLVSDVRRPPGRSKVTRLQLAEMKDICPTLEELDKGQEVMLLSQVAVLSDLKP